VAQSSRIVALPSRTQEPSPEPEGAEPLWRDALGCRLRALRRERGEKLTETAGRAGLSPQYLSEVERGRKDPSSEMVAALAGALGLTVGELAAQTAADLCAGQIARRPRAQVGGTPTAHASLALAA
jgi:DNA-binding XRE family transcriptional regulator